MFGREANFFISAENGSDLTSFHIQLNRLSYAVGVVKIVLGVQSGRLSLEGICHYLMIRQRLVRSCDTQPTRRETGDRFTQQVHTSLGYPLGSFQ